MKAILAAFLCSTISFAAIAHEVGMPQELSAAVRNLDQKKFTLVNGVLRINLDRRLVSSDLFSSAVILVCGEQWRNAKSLQRWGVKKIEVLNYIDAQGFALLDAPSACDVIGRAKNSDHQIAAAAVRCEAGVCRARP